MSKEHTKVVIYCTQYCPYCIRAKSLLNKKNITYTEVDLDHHPHKYDEMLDQTAGQSSVPQIFIGDKHIGGCDDMYELEAQNKLDSLLFPEQ